MLLLISTGTFIVLATLALIVWAGLVLSLTGRSRAKKKTRPTPAIRTFFQPTAGKIAIDVPVPMASYDRTELISLSRNSHNSASDPASSTVLMPTPDTASEPVAPILDDPAFAPTDPNHVPASPPSSGEQSVSDESKVSASSTSEAASSPTGFRLSLDRQLLSRLLSDDSLCQEFETVRALTLDWQRDTGRSYADLFREAVADKPADVQAMLLNLLDDEAEADYEYANPTYA